MKTSDTPKPRSYRQSARADTAAATYQRIVDVFIGFLRERWLDEITLADVAQAAGVTVQTVIRRFSGKEGLMQAAVEVIAAQVMERREAPSGELKSILAALMRDYEAEGDMMVRCLAQENRIPMLKIMLDIGRAEHRAWVEQSFKPWLGNLASASYQRRVLQLIVVTDVYTWKLLRRDQGKTPEEVVDIMADFVAKLCAESEAPTPEESKHE